MTRTIPNFKLPVTGASIPAIGYGTGTAWQKIKKARPADQQLDPVEDLISSVSNAIKVGFRHIDTAETYTTHEEVGEGIKRSGIDRKELFITDKYSPSAYARTKSTGPYESAKTALKELGIEYLDLYLLHTPRISKESVNLTLEDAWLQVEKLYNEGLVKNIGVSNFSVEYLERIAKVGKLKPQVNQIEFHAYLQDHSPGLVEYANENNILIEAYSPLAPLFRARPGPLDDLLPELTEKYGRSETQILLRWVYQQGILPLTTSSKETRLIDALNIFTFELSDEDVEKISNVGSQKRFRAFAKDLYGVHDEGYPQ